MFNNERVTPLLLITGYLGSGKTTLLNRILANEKGIKFAVIVNDIGEVNIDAALIEKGGVVGQKDESLVALQNGCICCTLKMDLIEQINEILAMRKFDYIVIEASGICEPEPIARTICSIPRMGEEFTQHGIARLDCIASVVDARRMVDEFNCGNDLKRNDLDEEDIENLLIQQIEFCDLVLLNKVADVTEQQLHSIIEIIRALQPNAPIIQCDYANVDLRKLLNTNLFRYSKTATSAAWVQQIDRPADELIDEEEEHHHHHDHEHHDEHAHDHCDHEHGICHVHDHEEHEEHEHHHHHHHHHDHDHDHEHGHTEEYGISTFVYCRRKPLDLNKFDCFVVNQMKNVIRAKGICWFSNNDEMSYLFEQSGRQRSLVEAGQWYATAPEEELMNLMVQDPMIAREWDEQVGDRMQKIVFIGKNMNIEELISNLDACLEE